MLQDKEHLVIETDEKEWLKFTRNKLLCCHVTDYCFKELTGTPILDLTFIWLCNNQEFTLKFWLYSYIQFEDEGRFWGIRNLSDFPKIIKGYILTDLYQEDTGKEQVINVTLRRQNHNVRLRIWSTQKVYLIY